MEGRQVPPFPGVVEDPVEKVDDFCHNCLFKEKILDTAACSDAVYETTYEKVM